MDSPLDETDEPVSIGDQVVESIRGGIIDVPVILCEEEKKKLPPHLLRLGTTSEQMWYAFELSFSSIPYIYRYGLYKLFIVDWIRTFLLGAASLFFVFLSQMVGNSIRGIENVASKIIVGVTICLVLIFVVVYILYHVSSILRIDSFRRLIHGVKNSMSIDVGSEWVWCPQCNRKCGLFTLQWFLVDLFELPFVTLLYLIAGFIPGGNMLTTAIYRSFFAFRAVFVAKEGFCSYFGCFSYYKKNWKFGLGIAFGFLCLGIIPFLSIIILPIATVVGIRVYYHIQHLENLGDETEMDNQHHGGIPSEMNQDQDIDHDYPQKVTDEVETVQPRVDVDNMKEELFGDVGAEENDMSLIT